MNSKNKTYPCDAPDWQALSQEALDRGFNNTEAVADREQIFKQWEAQSALIRTQYPEHLDLKYGPRERNRLDFFKGEAGAPVFMFIHGGYWQMHSKERFNCFAHGPLTHGMHVAVVEYTLCPEVTMDQMVAEIHQSLDFLVQWAPSCGADSQRIIVAGSSAGGHLTAMALSHPNVTGGIGISGLYDLEPIRHSYINAKLHLDKSMSLRQSPGLQVAGPMVPLVLLTGSSELPLMRKQTADFVAHRAQYGLPVHYEEIPGANHFTILHELYSPTGRITTLLRQLLQ